jgi:hypothetical protein
MHNERLNDFCWVVVRVFCIFLGVVLFWSALLFTMVVYVGNIPEMEGMRRLLSFWDYWYGFVGACFGILAAVLIERKIQMQKLAKGRDALKASVAHNQDLIASTLGFLQGGGESYFKLDTPNLSMWLGFSADVLRSEMFMEIETFRHELEHINNKLNTYTVYSAIVRTQHPAGENTQGKQEARLAELNRLGILVHLDAESRRATRILRMM